MNIRLWASAVGLSLSLLAQTAAASTFDIGHSAQRHGDSQAAFRLLEPQAVKGNAIAQFNLGLDYDEGRGIDQNYALAFKWYLAAAQNGLVEAQYTVGFFYRKGRGMQQNVVQAHRWFNTAAAGGLARADQARDDESREMSAAQIAQAQRLADAWLRTHGKLWRCGTSRCGHPNWLPGKDW